MKKGDSAMLLGGSLKSARLTAVLLLLSLVLLLLGLSITDRCGGRPGSVLRLPFSAPPKAPPAGSACKVSTQYEPSELERLWVAFAVPWQEDFCSHMTPLDNSTRVWLDTLAEHSRLQERYRQNDNTSPAEALVQQQRMDPRVFSRFRTTYDCGNHTSEQVTWIEPLSHGLRHPNALCNRGANVMDRSYLLLAHRAEHAAAARLGNVQCQGRACQAIYFDLGATTLQPTPDEAGQGWFFKAYQQQGIAFDRYLLWEARPKDPAAVFKHVPKGDMHKYQYFNVPVTSDTSDPSNPVNILKTIAQPGDFVVFKLDIDNFDIEHKIVEAIQSDPQARALIDEFFFEDHVDFAPMLPYWGSFIKKGSSLASSYKLFSALRQQGVRAHSWV